MILTKKGANYFGEESIDADGKKHRHMAVVRGQGVLTLREDALHFEQWLTKKVYHIPISQITHVTTSRSHNGKFNLFHVLQVHYMNEAQEHRIFGIQVGWKKDVLQWKTEIESLVANKD
jgi:hypothetical protein